MYDTTSMHCHKGAIRERERRVAPQEMFGPPHTRRRRNCESRPFSLSPGVGNQVRNMIWLGINSYDFGWAAISRLHREWGCSTGQQFTCSAYALWCKRSWQPFPGFSSHATTEGRFIPALCFISASFFISASSWSRGSETQRSWLGQPSQHSRCFGDV